MSKSDLQKWTDMIVNKEPSQWEISQMKKMLEKDNFNLNAIAFLDTYSELDLSKYFSEEEFGKIARFLAGREEHTDPTEIKFFLNEKEEVVLSPTEGSLVCYQIYDYEDKINLAKTISDQLQNPDSLIIVDTTKNNLDSMDYDKFVKTGGHEAYEKLFRIFTSEFNKRKAKFKIEGVRDISELYAKNPTNISEFPIILPFVIEPLYSSYFLGGFKGNLEQYAEVGIYWIVPSSGFSELEYCVGPQNKTFSFDNFSHAIALN